ncbi:CRISPR-associated endonuclease Cas2 [Aquisalimonas sp.]|uniref:CRISPR-associated endonuclease Cas2 n=1 Tax=Aquisalimonas sp. TaxID=1872621 RepID=UPI0025BD56C5|nr:CRISPR-associated endonuclease Cas2 [Aquisalimonas sp.]
MRRKLYLAAYDVRDHARLAQALRVIRGYASGGQKSAYECWLTPAERRALQREMAGVLDLAVDAFSVIPLELRRPLVTLGAAIKPADPDFFYFG